VKRFITDFGGAFKKPRSGGLTYEISGSTELEQKLISMGQQLKVRRFADIAPRLRGGETLYVVFDNEDAMKVSADLISLGHPLLTAARSHLADEAAHHWRNGSLTVVGDQPGDYLTLFFILELTGSNPSRELKSVSIHISSGHRLDEIGEYVLRSVAEGTASGGVATSSPDLGPIVKRLESAAADIRDVVFRERENSNEAIIAAREATLRNTFEFKIKKVDETLSSLGRSADSRILRLHEGRKKNLIARLHAALEDLDLKRELTATWRPVALGHITVIAG